MATPAPRRWQDVQAGEVFNTGLLTLSRRDILEFAADFDPQPYHLDPEAADASIFGGLCASGWHVCAVMMRLLSDTLAAEQIAFLGSEEVRELRWYKPVFVGDSLSASITTIARQAPGDGADHGLIDCRIRVDNQHGNTVMELVTSLLLASEPGSP